MFLLKVWGFIKRDLRIQSSYRLLYFFQIGRIISSLLTFFFISKLMGNNQMLNLQGYGGDYFTFVVIGIAFSRYQGMALSVGDILEEEQDEGTLEAILLTPTTPFMLLLAGLFYKVIETSFYVFFYIVIGMIFFHMQVRSISLIALFLVIFLSITAYMGIGLLSTSFVLIYKQGDPVTWVLGGVSKFLGGVFFPVILLPEWAQKISSLLPITYSLRAIRGVMLKGNGMYDISAEFAVLFVFSLLFLPAGICFLHYAIDRAKKDGSLLHV